MGAKYSTKKDLIGDMQKNLEALDGRKVEVGCLKGKHQWLAAIHEYGCRITVTPKMRAYLHSQGIHLKKSTTQIVIPERSFIRAGYDDRIDGVMKHANVLMQSVLNGKMDEQKFLKTLGLYLSSEIKEYATNLSDPPNSSFTVKQKGSSNPLWDTGQMIGGITYKVE